ncbi:cyclopropane fatty acyl phospholipid synthase [Candidatus Electrothrix sp.]|uniref:cyclopropane fatty acyl phospholipid synthase n=1 Tax=Candidatus Electrothrix sp. TaxID=2170559 RepID=UPI004056E942
MSNVQEALLPPKILFDLAKNAGVAFNGDQPWDITVHDPVVYQRILSQGSLGFGEAYMDGQWDCPALDQLFDRLLSIEDIEKTVSKRQKLKLGIKAVYNKLRNLQNYKRAFQVGEQHYDIGNDLFEIMLDPTMSYSCAYWENANTLEQAQKNKLDMICQKLKLSKGERLLDIGCGWGGLVSYAAEYYGVEAVGITVSQEQQDLASAYCKGLPVRIELIDYRELDGVFDKIVSVGMFEHVGLKNYRTYFTKAADLLADHGLFLLHTIGRYKTSRSFDPWLNKYIFPNGKLPSAADIAQAADGLFLIEDWHSFGHNYDRTLMTWMKRFDEGWDKLKHRYDQRFYRMWKYYLLSCAGVFRSRRGQLWQIVLSKRAGRRSYRSTRRFSFSQEHAKAD